MLTAGSKDQNCPIRFTHEAGMLVIIGLIYAHEYPPSCIKGLNTQREQKEDQEMKNEGLEGDGLVNDKSYAQLPAMT